MTMYIHVHTSLWPLSHSQSRGPGSGRGWDSLLLSMGQLQAPHSIIHLLPWLPTHTPFWMLTSPSLFRLHEIISHYHLIEYLLLLICWHDYHDTPPFVCSHTKQRMNCWVDAGTDNAHHHGDSAEIKMLRLRCLWGSTGLIHISHGVLHCYWCMHYRYLCSYRTTLTLKLPVRYTDCKAFEWRRTTDNWDAVVEHTHMYVY